MSGWVERVVGVIRRTGMEHEVMQVAGQAGRRVAGRRRRHGGKRRWSFEFEGVMSLVAAIVFVGVAYAEISDLYVLKHRGEVVSALVLDERGRRTTRIEVSFVTLAGRPSTARPRTTRMPR